MRRGRAARNQGEDKGESQKKSGVILSGAPRGRRWCGAESKDPEGSQKLCKLDWTLFSHSTGFFTAHRPAAKARADAPFRMTPDFDAIILGAGGRRQLPSSFVILHSSFSPT